MIRSMFKGILMLFGLCMVVGLIQGIRNPLPQQPVAKVSPEEQALGRDIMARAYAVGKSLSMAGSVKPTSDKVDAMSRQLQTKMGVAASQRWFKQHFEAGFWQGWKAR